MKIIFLLLALQLSVFASSQHARIATIVKEGEIRVGQYEMTKAGSEILYLPLLFGKAEFTYTQADAVMLLTNSIIAGIDLVYSDFPAKQNFSLLTQKRLENLQKLLPFVFNDPGIEFRKFRQTGAKNQEEAEGLVHGFFIYYRPKATREGMAVEIEKLKETKGILDLLLPGSTKERASWDTNRWCRRTTLLVDTTGYKAPPRNAKRTVKKMSVKEYVKSGLLPKINEADYKDVAIVYHLEDRIEKNCRDALAELDTIATRDTIIIDVFNYVGIDSTVAKVLDRNKWEKEIIIADVTGSMYPYTKQLLQWLKLNLVNTGKKYFVFFNDGDTLPDHKKIIGKTGGIYSVETNKYDAVEEAIKQAMRNGGGGDAPENNIEALIESTKLCPDCDSIIMIADNWAPVKDISLLKGFNKPVKVVLCGVFDKVNRDYIRIAWETKGSLHFMEEDIYDLANIKEGGMIKIRGVMYKLVKGEFISMGRLSL